MITEAIRHSLLSFSLLLAGVFHELPLLRRTAPQLSESLRPLLLPRIAFYFMQKNITPVKKKVKPAIEASISLSLISFKTDILSPAS